MFTQEDAAKDGNNWYVYCGNSPVLRVDWDGEERIVISGGITSEDYNVDGTRSERFKYMFIETALREITIQVEMRTRSTTTAPGQGEYENNTWIVINYNYTFDDIIKFTEAANNRSVNLVVINSKQELINYINTKRLNERFITCDRDIDPITSLHIFSHGYRGELAFGHNSITASNLAEGMALNFTIEDIEKLNSTAFRNTYSVFYSCNTGTNTNGEGTSFAQAWVNKTGGTALAVVGGKTNYENINIVRNLSLIDYANKLLKSIDRDKHGFSYSGSVNAPVPSIGVKWGTFNPQ